MAGTVSFNPNVTTGFTGNFLVSTQGYVVGTFLPDPANRYNLEGGVVSASQATPLWGGLPVTLAVPNPGSPSVVGPAMVAAASLSGINAWTLFDQSAAGMILPGSNVPLYPSGQSLNFARPGSNLRIVLPLYASDVNGLEGAAPNVALYWDPTNNRLTTTSGGNYGPLPIQLEFLDTASKTVNYASSVANWAINSSVAVVRI